MSMLRRNIEKRCQGCRMLLDHCFCQFIPNLKIESKISLIVHMREYYLPSTTSYYTQKALPNHSEILIRGKKDEPLNLAQELKITGMPLVIYPTEDAELINAEWVKNNPGPYHLIVPDGTWSQTQKVCRREDYLSNIKKITFKVDKVSQYKLRKSSTENRLCTMEAIIEALKILEPQNSDEIMKLENFFHLLVEKSLKARSRKP